jgi:aspartate kinase
MDKEKTIVLKFGGSALGAYENLGKSMPKIKNLIKDYLFEGYKVIVVVSAITGETRKLRGISNALYDVNDLKSIDETLSLGEFFSARILSTYLKSKDINSSTFLELDLPIKTTDQHLDADIVDIDINILNDRLKNHDVIIIPGFIGKNSKGEITTLSLDGSDTTAVYTAAALNTECVLYKDVLGVYTANPRRVPLARKISQLNYDYAKIFSVLGARVIHPKAIEKAKINELPLEIKPIFSEKNGTKFVPNGCEHEVVGVTYYLHPNDMITVSVVGKNIMEKEAGIIDVLSSNNVNLESMPSTFNGYDVTFKLLFQDDLDRSLRIIHSYLGLDDVSTDKAKVVNNKDNYYDPALIK